LSSTIKILPQFIANRIAAGEVVGRPEAVVKELIENSVDAGAKNIQLIIKDAGKSLIRIIDDGSGMNEDDALMSFQRHATSKIKTADDLENIKTLGFRGEALASIAAVAQVEMLTRAEGDELGTMLKNYGNEIVEHTKEQSETGTSITVKNLFYNTPARRNFLKSNQTEFRHIYDTFQRLAIANHSVGFLFINEDEVLFDLKPADLQNRLMQIYGIKFAELLIEVDHSTELISLKGFISKPSFTKKNKQDQNLYLNNRYVTSKSLSFAVHMAYEDLIEKGDYPNFFLFLTLDPRVFDVNVHPSKLEVKFEDERAIFGFIRKGVWNTLEKNDLIVRVNLDSSKQTGFTLQKKESNILSANSFLKRSDYGTGLEFTKHSSYENTSGKIHELFAKQHDNSGGGSKEIENVREPESDDIIDPVAESDTRIENEKNEHVHDSAGQDIDNLISKNEIWQFQRKYIMYQMENTLMIIDQHAAHERILYEQALDRLNSHANLSQQLLMPIYIELNPVDYEVAKSIEKELQALGFDIELQSKRKVKMKGIPSDVRIGNEAKILQELIDEFKENDVKLNLEKRDNLAKTYGCKHAIKAGDALNESEMLNLIDKLFSVKMPYVCPHGRPTIVKVSMDELDKMFARKGF
jgi:DNA mismatch repair protein MutL